MPGSSETARLFNEQRRAGTLGVKQTGLKAQRAQAQAETLPAAATSNSALAGLRARVAAKEERRLRCLPDSDPKARPARRLGPRLGPPAQDTELAAGPRAHAEPNAEPTAEPRASGQGSEQRSAETAS